MAASNLTELITDVTNLVALVIPIALGIALLALFWGIFQAFGKTDSVERRSEARQTLLWSMFAIFIVITLGGIIVLFTSSFLGG